MKVFKQAARAFGLVAGGIVAVLVGAFAIFYLIGLWADFVMALVDIDYANPLILLVGMAPVLLILGGMAFWVVFQNIRKTEGDEE